MKKSLNTGDTVFNKTNIPEQLETTIGYSEQERMQLIRQSYIDIINIVSDAIYVLDESFTFIEVNKGAEKMYQFTREELIGQTPDSVAAPEMNDMPVILNKMKSVLETAKEVQFDFWAKRKNGEVFPKSVIINKGKFFEQNVLIATARDITEQKKVEQELNELKSNYNNLPEAISKQLKSSENLHQSILQTAMDGYWMVDKKGKILEVNDSYCQMIGYSNEELLKMWVADIEYIESQEDVEAHIQYVIINGSGRFETCHQRKDKTIVNLDVSIQQQLGTENIIAFFRDITERKLIENQLRSSEERYRMIAENTTDVIWKLNLVGKYTFVSPSIFSLRGYTAEEVMNQTMDEMICPDSLPLIQQLFENSLKEYYEHNITESGFLIIEQPCKEGTTVWTESTVKLVLDENGEPQGYVGVSRNISERRKAEQEVQKISKHFQTIIEKSPDGFVLLNESGKFKYASPTALRMFGYKFDELIHTDPVSLTHPDDVSMVLGHLTKLFENPTHIPVIEYRFKHSDGSWSWIESTFSNLLTDPNIESILINYRDISDRKLSDIALIESKERLNRAEIASKSGNWELMLDTMIMKSSQGAARIYGLERDQFTFAEVAKIPLPEYRSIMDLALKNLIEKNEPYDIEFKIKTADKGEIKEIHSTAYYNKETKILFGIIQDVTEKKQTEEALAQREKIHKMILQASFNGFWIVDLQGNILEVNESYSRISGYSIPELLKMKISDLELQESIVEVKNHIDRIKNAGYDSFETQHKRKDGRIIDVNNNVQYQSINGTEFIVAFITDITERKLNEKKIENNSLLLRDLLIASSEFIDNQNYDVNFKKLSDKVFEISGAKFGSFNMLSQNQTDFRTVALSGIDKLQQSIKSILGFDLINKDWKYDPNKERKTRHNIITKFGSLAELTGSVLPRNLINLISKMFNLGEIWIVQIKKQDIVLGDFTLLFTKNTTLQNPEILELYAKQIALYIIRNKAEGNLRESEKKYKILFAENPQPMLVYDLETLAVLEVNQTAVDFYGYTKEEFLSMTLVELHPREEIPTFLMAIDETRKGKNTDGVSLHQKKNGNKVYVNISATSAPIFGKNARHILIEDITERLLSEKKLAESERFFRQSQQAAKIGSYNLNLATGMWTSSEVLDNIFDINENYDRSVQGWLGLVYEEDRKMMNDYFANHVIGQRLRFNKEYRISRISDGKILWVLGLGELIIENNVITAMVGTIQDISERKLIEEVLKAKMDDLIRFQRVTVGRELMMIDLKKEINELLAKLGQEPKYKIFG
ncbi:MAG: PAS domain S-box protein [Paludibacter sp.]